MSPEPSPALQAQRGGAAGQRWQVSRQGLRGAAAHAVSCPAAPAAPGSALSAEQQGHLLAPQGRAVPAARSGAVPAQWGSRQVTRGDGPCVCMVNLVLLAEYKLTCLPGLLTAVENHVYSHLQRSALVRIEKFILSVHTRARHSPLVKTAVYDGVVHR